MKEIYVVMEPDIEGRQERPIGYFSSLGDARAVCEGNNWRAVVGPKLLFESSEEFRNFESGKLRESALAKLTPAERTILGLG